MKSRTRTKHQLDCEIGQSESRVRLCARVQRLINKWEPRLGVHVRDWKLKEMKRYWGSANKAEGSIWINPQIAELSPPYLEYIVVHEMVHLLTEGHDAKFYALMDDNLPRWRHLHEKIEEPLTQYS